MTSLNCTKCIEKKSPHNTGCVAGSIMISLISSHLALNIEGRWGTTDNFVTRFLHLSLFSTALWDWANSRPVHSLMLSSTSSSVCLVFFPLSLCLARWFYPDLMNGKHDHTTADCVSKIISAGSYQQDHINGIDHDRDLCTVKRK